MGRKDEGFGARGQLTESCPVSVLIEAEHVLVGGAIGGKESCMAFSGKSIDHRPELLVRKVLQVKSKMGRTSNSKIGPGATTILSSRGDEETHWPSHLVALVVHLPLAAAPQGGQGSINGAVMLLAMAPRTPLAS